MSLRPACISAASTLLPGRVSNRGHNLQHKSRVSVALHRLTPGGYYTAQHPDGARLYALALVKRTAPHLQRDSSSGLRHVNLQCRSIELPSVHSTACMLQPCVRLQEPL